MYTSFMRICVFYLYYYFFLYFFHHVSDGHKIEKTHCTVFAFNPDKEMRVGWMLLFYQTTPMRVNGSMIQASAVHIILNSFKWATACVCNHTLYLSNQYMRILNRTQDGYFKGESLLFAKINLVQKCIRFNTTVYNISIILCD